MNTVTSSPHTLAAALTRIWARFYTFGLSKSASTRRRLQIESDLWEHWSDLRGSPAASLRFNLHTLDRLLRGAVADALWRFQLEGPYMQINIPIDRVAGLLLLLLIGAMALSISASGYDTAHPGFESELSRLADVAGWQVTVYTALQAIAGLGMVLAAIVFYLQLRDRALMLALIAAAGLAVAGVLTIVGSALYASAAEVADQWAAAPSSEQAALVTARALLIALGTFTPVMLIALVCGVEALAVACAQNRLVPRWLGVVAALAAGILATAIPLAWVSDGLAWFLPGLTVLLLMLWLAVAGGTLLLGQASSPGSRPADEREPMPQP